MLLVWDVMGKVMGVVWGVANFTALLSFFPGENTVLHGKTSGSHWHFASGLDVPWQFQRTVLFVVT